MGVLHKIRKAARSFPDPMFRRALRLGVAPSHEHRAMLSSLGDVRTVVDVGANVGQFALLTLRVLPNAHVHSFEPLPDAADKFQKVIDGNAKVTLHRMALGAQEALMPIHVTQRSDSSSLLAPALQSVFYPGTHEVRTHDVQVVPLDHVLSQAEIKQPALLKIDVQGYEQQVLDGCVRSLHLFDWIFVEMSFIELYSGQTLAPAVLHWLSEQGFELSGIYADDASYKDGRMIQADFLFCRRSFQTSTPTLTEAK